MTELKLDLNKLDKLDKNKPHIFYVEVGDINRQDVIYFITAVKETLINKLGFKCVYFIPTHDGVSDVVFDNLNNYALKESPKSNINGYKIKNIEVYEEAFKKYE